MRLIALSLAAWSIAGFASQGPADFSGRWTVEPPAAAPEATPAAAALMRGDPGSGWGSTIVITQDARRLVVETPIYSRYDLQPQPRFVYALDGTETRNTLMMGRGLQVQSSRASWKGQTLTITTVHTYTDPASGKPLTIDVTQQLSLESPTRLVVEATRAAPPGATSTTRTLYARDAPTKN